ncbi:hypothetical protein APT56_07375 [Achromobacter denitrificans]|nr:hypothetical protein APT56_07375 [Achromobacter denitrificans]
MPGNSCRAITRAASSPPPAPTPPASGDWPFNCAATAPSTACAMALAAGLSSPIRHFIPVAK